MKTILIFGAKPEIRELLKLDDGVGFLDSTSFNHWVIDGQEIALFPEANSFAIWPEAIKRIRDQGPLFSRYFDDLPRLELQIRLMAFQIVRLSSALKKLGVKYVVFPTGVSHHIITAQCEIACALSKIPQIFTYLTNLSPHLLPIVQLNSIHDRKPLGIHISHSNLDLFSSGNSFIKYNVISERHKEFPVQNFYIASLQVMKLVVHRNMAHLKERLVNFVLGKSIKLHNPYVPLRQYSLTTELRFLLEQKKVLKFHLNQIQTDLEKLNSESIEILNCPVIYAHQQPEATTFPEGGDFQNHIDMVVELRAKGYQGPIFYLEHPATYNFTSFGSSTRVGTLRSKEYFLTLQHLGCFFVNRSYVQDNEFQLQPFTISGSIAIERSFEGKFTVVAGQPWFKGLPGTLTIDEYLENTQHQTTNDIRHDAIKFIEKTFQNKLIINGLILKHESGPLGRDIPIFESEYRALIKALSEDKSD